MTDLETLADAAGLARSWKDFRGDIHDVAPDTLRAVLAAIGLPAASPAHIADSLARARAPASDLPLITGVTGETVAFPVTGRFRLTLEDGSTLEGRSDDGTASLPAIATPGYHRLEANGRETTIAIAPPRCRPLPRPRGWGFAAQLYALRRDGDGGIGDFAALRDFVRAAARHGADAVAISPVHAQFSADPDRFSPYAPSSRVMLNVLHADAPTGVPTGAPALEATDLVDWPAAARARLAGFRAQFAGGDIDVAGLAAFRAAHGDALESHARFEALHAHFLAQDRALWHWRTWPEPYRRPDASAVAAFAAANPAEIAFHAWLQYRADQGWAAAQAGAKAAGMGIGLISDLAVGTDSGGSHGWSRQGEMLLGLSVGAPPDPLGPLGQNWGITAFSPRGLQAHGFAAFIEMLRAALRHAGGVRIDHVMGLARLWVIPEGGTAADGAYLGLPVTDLLRLVALECHRHDAIVLGEDLGTLPDGFHERLIDAGLLGLRVLWFERTGEHSFRPPAEWSQAAVAMSTTHDLPTVAGWWRGVDLGWRRRTGVLADDDAVWFAHENRARDRAALWSAFQASGAASGDPPPPDDPARAVDAAVVHIGQTSCDFVLLPVEDALAREEQPNLPGTIDEHPNWRRRFPGPAARLLDPPEIAARVAALARAREAGRPGENR